MGESQSAACFTTSASLLGLGQMAIVYKEQTVPEYAKPLYTSKLIGIRELSKASGGWGTG